MRGVSQIFEWFVQGSGVTTPTLQVENCPREMKGLAQNILKEMHWGLVLT